MGIVSIGLSIECNISKKERNSLENMAVKRKERIDTIYPLVLTYLERSG